MNRRGYARNFIGAHVRQGIEHHNAKLNDEKVREMRRLHQDKGLCIKCIAIMHKVPYPTAWQAINYETWKHVK